jgi:predicted TIM-barrel fold metal-dependent hydrolase
MMIIDCHCHVARTMTGFWQPLRYGKVQDEGKVFQIFPPSFDPTSSQPEVLLGHMDDVGVDRAFLVQHHLYGDQNATVLECVKSWPDRFVGYAYLGKMDQPDAPDQLERLIEQGMLGLKVEVASTRRLRLDFRFDGDREMRIWERLNQLGRPLALDLIASPPEDVTALQKVVDACPRVQFVNCHVGGPVTSGWQERAMLTKRSNGWFDLAVATMVGRGEEYPFPKAQEFVRWAVDTFGADRIMWGTDYPPVLRQATYRQHLDWVRKHCDFLTDAQRADILGGTAERYLRKIGVA